MGRFAFIVAYDGTRYQGFQIQRQGPTIQGELEAALHRITGEAPRVVGAGRTDTGVHALGQVVACDLAPAWDPADLERALNAVLPPDIAVRQVTPAPAGFHPRFSARTRAYRYRIWNAPTRLPTERLYSLHVPRPLDVAAMHTASQALVGEHDFATFGSPVGHSPNTVRVLYEATWAQEGPRIWFDVVANAFLRRMVRGLVGTLLLVGRRQEPPEVVAELLAACDRSRSGPSAPPQGLCLMQVTYPAELGLIW